MIKNKYLEHKDLVDRDLSGMIATIGEDGFFEAVAYQLTDIEDLDEIRRYMEDVV